MWTRPLIAAVLTLPAGVEAEAGDRAAVRLDGDDDGHFAVGVRPGGVGAFDYARLATKATEATEATGDVGRYFVRGGVELRHATGENGLIGLDADGTYGRRGYTSFDSDDTRGPGSARGR